MISLQNIRSNGDLAICVALVTIGLLGFMISTYAYVGAEYRAKVYVPQIAQIEKVFPNRRSGSARVSFIVDGVKYTHQSPVSKKAFPSVSRASAITVFVHPKNPNAVDFDPAHSRNVALKGFLGSAMMLAMGFIVFRYFKKLGTI